MSSEQQPSRLDRTVNAIQRIATAALSLLMAACFIFVLVTLLDYQYNVDVTGWVGRRWLAYKARMQATDKLNQMWDRGPHID